MVKTLRPVGNSLGLIIDRSILDLLGIDRTTPLRLTTDGRGIYVEPVGADRREGTPDEVTQANHGGRSRGEPR